MKVHFQLNSGGFRIQILNRRTFENVQLNYKLLGKRLTTLTQCRASRGQ